MKILIFSDSHGTTQPMQEWIRIEKPDHLIHLGDFYNDLPSALRVPGNCDPYKLSARVKTATFHEVQVFLTHGHQHGVKRELEALKRSAAEAGARLVLFGHTHIPAMMETEGMILLNPGSARTSGLCVEIDDEIRVRFLGETEFQEVYHFPLK